MRWVCQLNFTELVLVLKAPNILVALIFAVISFDGLHCENNCNIIRDHLLRGVAFRGRYVLACTSPKIPGKVLEI